MMNTNYSNKIEPIITNTMNAKESSRSIVLVDDDPINNMINVKIIERNLSSFKINVFTNPIEALHKLKNWSLTESQKFPEFIFLDINMPEIDGWEFLEQFEQLPPSILRNCAVIMLSSSIDYKDIERSKKYKTVKEFISKPLSADKLGALAASRLN